MTKTILRCLGTLAVTAYLFALIGRSLGAAELRYPDLVAWGSEPKNLIFGGEFDTDVVPGHSIYRFNAAIPNIGDGPFELRLETDENAGLQDIYQRIFDTDGEVTEEFVGTFAYEPSAMGSLSFSGLARYNLRAVVGQDGVGEIVAGNDKTSHCVVDSLSHDLSLPDAPATRKYRSCHTDVLGISIGWADLYTSALRNQWVDATGLPSGQYWLEVVVDPENRVLETDENNNVTRILVNLDVPPPSPLPGDLDTDGDIDFDDIGPFVLSLTSPTQYQTDFGVSLNEMLIRGDLSDNGLVDFDDITPFVELLTSPGTATATAADLGTITVPEPSSILLAMMAFFGSLFLRRSR